MPMSSPMQKTVGSRSISSQIPWRIASRYVSWGMTGKFTTLLAWNAFVRLPGWVATLIVSTLETCHADLDQLVVERAGGLGGGSVCARLSCYRCGRCTHCSTGYRIRQRHLRHTA